MNEGNRGTKRQRRNNSPGLERGFGAEVEKVKEVMKELKGQWSCPKNEHPTVCIPQFDQGGRCKVFSIKSIQSWAKLVVRAMILIYCASNLFTILF
jgi:hypothetical protein